MEQPAFDNVCHVYIDPEPNRGDWNMAVDELLLTAAVERGHCSVRLYRWVEPTISLGYFQRLDDMPPALRAARLPVVRRLTGGGAILHHHELTYSCAVPSHHPLARVPNDLYLRVHERVIQVVTSWGIPLRLRGTQRNGHRDEFLCFARGDSFDVVLQDGHKVLGSAQRRRKGALLQHGSLVLARSEHAPQIPGILDQTWHRLPVKELAAHLAPTLAALFLERSLLTNHSLADIRRIHELLPGYADASQVKF